MEKHFKQLIIARRDLNMSPGKYLLLSSLRFLARESARFLSSKFIYDGVAKELGMIEGVDYFPIVDACESIEARIPQYYIRRSWVI